MAEDTPKEGGETLEESETDNTLRPIQEARRVVQVTPELERVASFTRLLINSTSHEDISQQLADLSEVERIRLLVILDNILPPSSTPKDAPEQNKWSPSAALKNARNRVSGFGFGEFGGVNPSIEASTTFTTMSPDIMKKLFKGEISEEGCYLYSRHFNPTSYYLGVRLAALEDTEIAYPTASGMSAITVVLEQLLNRGDHLISSGTLYGGTRAYIENMLVPEEEKGVQATFIRPSETDKLIDNIKNKHPKVVYVETEANPTMEIVNLPRIAEAAHEVGAVLVVDNTFTPCTFTPSHYGADIVVYSTTKFLNGTSDAVGGAICCSEELLFQLMDLKTGRLMLSGPVMGIKDAAQLNLYLSSLPERIRAHSQRTLIYARDLERKGLKVYYPGLASHPHHELATSIMNPQYGYGGMLCIDFETEERAEIFVKKLQELGGGLNAVSLGYFETLASVSGKTTSSEIAEEDREEMGLSSGLARLSIGYAGNLEEEWHKMEAAVDFALSK